LSRARLIVLGGRGRAGRWGLGWLRRCAEPAPTVAGMESLQSEIKSEIENELLGQGMRTTTLVVLRMGIASTVTEVADSISLQFFPPKT